MKKKPSTYATLFTSTQDEAMLFDMWFRERSLDCDMRPSDDTDEASVVDADMLERSRGDYDGNIAAGQVRILAKRFTETPEVVPFVVVLEKWEDRGGDDDMWLVAPFSPYSTPATSGEMASGENLLWREVIQAWNARTVQGALLKKSYLCGNLDERIVSEASALFRFQFAGTTLPSDFSALRGPVVELAVDPRREYLSDEVARFQPLSTAVKARERARAENLLVIDFAKAREDREDGTILQPLYASEEFRLAAAGKPVPTTEHFRMLGVELTLMHSPEAGTAVFTFWDKDDRPDASYDGCSVLGTGGEFLGAFKNGSLSVPADAVKGWFQLTDKNGNALKLVKE